MRQRVHQDEPAHERFPDAEHELDRLGRLDHAEKARENSQDSALGAGRHETRRRRLGVETAVARALRRPKTDACPSNRKIEA